MSCPLNAKRWAGSGYCKPDAPQTEAAKEMQRKLQELQNARATQDATFFPYGADAASASGGAAACTAGKSCGGTTCTPSTCKKLK